MSTTDAREADVTGSHYRPVFNRYPWLLIPAAMLALPLAILWGAVTGLHWWLIEMREFPHAWKAVSGNGTDTPRTALRGEDIQ